MWKDYMKIDPDAPIFVHEEEAFERYDEKLSKIFAVSKSSVSDKTASFD